MVLSTTEKATEAPQTAAAIDIGTNAVRMAIAQIYPDNRIDVLEQMSRPCRLGHDTFRTGKLSRETVGSLLSILRDFRQVLSTYGVELIRAVATSAVSEASNRDAVLDRIGRTVDLDIDVIEPVEQSRLTVSAVRHSVEGQIDLSKGTSLIVDVGGGSTRITMLKRGQIAASHDFDIGSVRMQDMLLTSNEPPLRAADTLRKHVFNTVQFAKKSMGLRKIRTFIAIGGGARFAAQHAGGRLLLSDLSEVDREDLERFIQKTVTLAPDVLARTYNTSILDAERLIPGLLVYNALLEATGVNTMIVTNVTMREGLLLDLPRYVTGLEDPELTESILTSARTIAEKYSDDARHSAQVAELSVRIFDALGKDHGLKPRHRLLLQVAAQLHEIGKFVGSRGHHRHSQYLISHSEILGLRRADIRVVAQVARYHRGGPPKSSHLEYTSMPRRQRIVINKLAAILRVADALYKGHLLPVDEFDLKRQGNELVVSVGGTADMNLARRALAVKSDLLEDIFGITTRLEQNQRGAVSELRAGPDDI